MPCLPEADAWSHLPLAELREGALGCGTACRLECSRMQVPSVGGLGWSGAGEGGAWSSQTSEKKVFKSRWKGSAFMGVLTAVKTGNGSAKVLE